MIITRTIYEELKVMYPEGIPSSIADRAANMAELHALMKARRKAFPELLRVKSVKPVAHRRIS